jgi:hypothetical protein
VIYGFIVDLMRTSIYYYKKFEDIENKGEMFPERI